MFNAEGRNNGVEAEGIMGMRQLLVSTTAVGIALAVGIAPAHAQSTAPSTRADPRAISATAADGQLTQEAQSAPGGPTSTVAGDQSTGDVIVAPVFATLPTSARSRLRWW